MSAFRISTLTVALVVIAATAANADVTIDLSEVFIEVYHGHVDNASIGYGIAFGFAVEATETATVTSATFTPFGKSPIALSGRIDDGQQVFEYLDVDTFNPETLAGAGYPLGTLQSMYPDGDWTLSITHGGSTETLDVTFAMTLPTGTTEVLYPAPNSTIHTAKPVFIRENLCTNCNGVEVQVANASGEGMEYDPNLHSMGLQPNVVTYSDFFGPYGYTDGVSEGTGLAADDYLLQYSTYREISSILSSDTDGFEYFIGGYSAMFSIFTVSADTATSSDVSGIHFWLINQLAIPGGADEGFLGWLSEVEVNGSNLGDVTVYPPNLDPIALSDYGDGEFGWESNRESDRAAALAHLPATDGASEYVVMVDGGRSFTTMTHDPSSPDGTLTITSPEDGATTGATPTFETTSTCSNCSYLSVFVSDYTTFGDVIDVNAVRFSFEENLDPGDYDWVLPDDFDEIFSGDISNGLPDDDYLAEGTTGVDIFTNALDFTATGGSDAFDFWTGEEWIQTISFSVVPEPVAGMMQLAALAALAGVARARRRRS